LSPWRQAAPFNVDGTTYATAEHFMMERTAVLFGDHATAARILAATDPGEVKSLRRQIQGFDEQAWEAHRYGVVVRGNLAKFGQHDALREYLLSTRHRVLVEASPLDRIWGIGLAANDERARQPSTWQGSNLLGLALMEVRDRLERPRHR
jgi:ribA/ribD-fused uncharacterized protein